MGAGAKRVITRVPHEGSSRGCLTTVPHDRSTRNHGRSTATVPWFGLDSLESAELSAVLEDEFGTDPFSSGLMPETVQEIVDFYAGAGETGVAAAP